MNKRHLMYSGLMIAFLIIGGFTWSSVQSASSQAEITKADISKTVVAKGCGCGANGCGQKDGNQDRANCGCAKAQNGEKPNFTDNNSNGICDRAE